MRWAFVFAGAVFACLAWSEPAASQSLQCRQETTPETRSACAERELDDLDDMVKFWRRQARQDQSGYEYFANRRERCDFDAACIAREYQTEISELQAQLEPAARLRVTSEYRGPIIVRPVATAAPMSELDQLMDRVILTDSRGWMFNRYDRGSVRNTRVAATNGRDAIVQSDYSYNGGMSGWVRAFIIGDRLACVEYHDFPGRCRPVGANSYAYGIAGRLALSALASAY